MSPEVQSNIPEGVETPPEIAALMQMIEDAGSVDAAMGLIQEQLHPNGLCGCCGAANPLGKKISAKGIPACSMLCAYHLLHPGDVRTEGHDPELQALRSRAPTEDVEPGGSEGLQELRSE